MVHTQQDKRECPAKTANYSKELWANFLTGGTQWFQKFDGKAGAGGWRKKLNHWICEKRVLLISIENKNEGQNIVF